MNNPDLREQLAARIKGDETYRPYCQECNVLVRMKRICLTFQCVGCRGQFTLRLERIRPQLPANVHGAGIPANEFIAASRLKAG